MKILSQWKAYGRLAAGVLALSFFGCTAEQPESSDAVTIGLLLPFTGPSAGTAANFERAVLYAAERVNAAGGIQGRELRILAKDTHSETARGKESAQALIDEGAIAVIGPESPEVAAAILPALNDAEVPLFSPLVGQGEEKELNCETPWFRLAPSARSLGEKLASSLSQEGIEKIAILYGSGDYNRTFRAALRAKFEGSVLGGEVVEERSLQEGRVSFAQEIKEVLASEPEAIVLSTSPEMGAVVVTEATLLGQKVSRWALSPLLKTPLFLQNVNTDDVTGAIGVAPKIYDQGEEFPSAFSDRWLGDEPLEGAFFYYDTVGLLTMALASLEDIDNTDHDELKEAIVAAASNQGLSTGWDDIEDGLQRIEDGRDVNYSGLTGPLLMRSCGDRRTGTAENWTIKDGMISAL